MKKIIIIGSGGAGKSTLARKLGKMMGVEVHHLDVLYWKPGWKMTDKKVWFEILSRLIKKESWIMDGNFGSSMDIRAKACDTIIFLDYPTSVCLFGILKRRVIFHGKRRPDMASGCPEKLDWEFIKWVAQYKRKEAPAIREKLKRYQQEGKQVYHLKTRREADQLFEQLSAIND